MASTQDQVDGQNRAVDLQDAGSVVGLDQPTIRHFRPLQTHLSQFTDLALLTG